MKLKYIKIVSLALAFNLASCDGFLDINTDPNNPTEAPLKQLLPSTQVDLAGALGFSPGGLSQLTTTYVGQTVQRGAASADYTFNGSSFGEITPWNILYSLALQDIEIIINQGTKEGAMRYVGVAQIQKAYLYSIMVDMWADVPFSEANKKGIIAPKYDLGEDIYPQLFLLLDEGIANLVATSTISPGADDLFYGGNMASWRKFAKTVKLKMYNQIRLKQNVTAAVDALITENDMISSAAEDFQLTYGNTVSPDNRNPAYEIEWGSGTSNYYINPYFYETMANMNTFAHRNYGGLINRVDPRIPYYFYNQKSVISASNPPENPCSYCFGYVQNGNFITVVPQLAGKGFLSIYQFSFNIDPNEGFDQGSSQTLCGLYPLGGKFDTGTGGAANLNGNPTIPQRLLTYDMRKYIEAELFLSGAATGGATAARTAFSAAMTASFTKVNAIATLVGAPTILTADRTAYTNAVLANYDVSTPTVQLEHIMTQKWIATFGFGVDAYTDYRRTGFPVIVDGDTDNLPFTDRTREYPFAFPWVTGSLQVNANAPAQKSVASPEAKPFWMN